MLLFVSDRVIITAWDARNMPTCGEVVRNGSYLGKIEISLRFQGVFK
jgi:hypothetical protein